jgi:hypothetical protein
MEGMKPITTHARKLVYDLLDLIPNVHQQASLKAMLAFFSRLGARPFPNTPRQARQRPQPFSQPLRLAHPRRH